MSFPAKELPLKEQVSPMTHDEAIRIIERAGQDKYLSRELDQLREKCCLFISDVMHDVNHALAEKDKQTPALLRSKKNSSESAVSLRAAARERENQAKQRKELAEAMVIGALLNSDNPNWNPMNPKSGNHTGNGGSLLLALLKTSSDWMK